MIQVVKVGSFCTLEAIIFPSPSISVELLWDWVPYLASLWERAPEVFQDYPILCFAEELGLFVVNCLLEDIFSAFLTLYWLLIHFFSSSKKENFGSIRNDLKEDSILSLVMNANMSLRIIMWNMFKLEKVVMVQRVLASKQNYPIICDEVHHLVYLSNNPLIL